MNRPIDLSIIIPAFNEGECLEALVAALEQAMNGCLARWETEILIVDDHSTDGSTDKIRRYCEKYPWLKMIRLLKNSGSHTAIYAGLTRCDGQFAYIMGADLQDPVEAIPKFLDEITKGYKVVLGERESRSDPFLKKYSATCFNLFLSKFIIPSFPKNGGDVFLLDRDIIDAVIQCQERNTNIFILMLFMCPDVGTVKYERSARFAGTSKWNMMKLIKLAFDSFVTVGLLPIKIVLWVGVFNMLLAILLSIITIINKLCGNIEATGWASTITAILLVGGVNLISIGILGEYLGRNFDQTRKRPLFLIEEESL